jgi:hypothetical protein
MPNRTQIVCLHEGERGRSIDPVFINRLIKDLLPSWIRPWESNTIRLVSCAGRDQLATRMPVELKACLKIGSDTTLMVWADLDDNMPNGDALKEECWKTSQKAGIQRQEFDNVVFIFAKDRLENWVEFLNTGTTDENREGPRVSFKEAVEAARKLARMCNSNAKTTLPPSLQWSCKNWRKLVERMSP